MTTLPNTPVPDELNAVRLEIALLEERERELKRLLLENPDLREGNHWIAEVKQVHTTYTDLKELRAMHKDLVAEFTFPKTVTRIELSGVTEDGELVSARKMRAAQG